MVNNQISCKSDWMEFKKRSGAECYVRMTDSFMSGWGRAENMRNILYVAVKDLQDAYKLISWIHWKRPEMKRVDYGYFRDQPPKVIYDSTALVQGCVYNTWLKSAGCKELEGGEA